VDIPVLPSFALLSTPAQPAGDAGLALYQGVSSVGPVNHNSHNREFSLVPLVLVSGYAFAWVSHSMIEKNKPATLNYPLWLLALNIKMLFCFLTGRMGAELQKAGVQF